ncbi:MAG: 50S ribosomal protein L29 [Phycisphaerae bacterium]|nr:50S ribosomal protein L29 [Phycisphaerae bacterium]
MKAKQYREMAAGELVEKLEELQKSLFELRSQSVTEKIENSHAVGNARRNVARIKTILKEKQ